MSDYFAVITFPGTGVTLYLPVDLDYSSYKEEQLEEKLEAIANKLGGIFLYTERSKSD